jgi:hypothetical protein
MPGGFPRFPLSALLILAMPVSVGATGLRAGAARVEITPPLGLSMYGYGYRKGVATGVLDPLMARVLVLEAAEKRLALVVMDLGEPLAAEWIERLRVNASRSSGISYVAVAATHTHSGPGIFSAASSERLGPSGVLAGDAVPTVSGVQWHEWIQRLPPGTLRLLPYSRR